MYGSLDKIDLAAEVGGRTVAIQTDHRTRDEIEATPELSALFAMARVLNARSHLAERGVADAAVHYVTEAEIPPLLHDALAAVGATLERSGDDRARLAPLGPASDDAIGAVADRAFADLARHTAHRTGSRDIAIALRMLEDQTLAAPPERGDEPAYWQRVLELAALAGELLRAKYPQAQGWVASERAMVPFGFQLDASTILFPTNRAQRVIEDGDDESLFKLLIAAEETMTSVPGDHGRLMPSLRDRHSVELDEIVWRSVLPDAGPVDLPIVVCGIDGESTFGMIRRDALERTVDDAMADALANLAAEDVELEAMRAGALELLVASGSFYAAEKILDEAFMRGLHERFGARLLAAAVPTRGLLLVTSADQAAAGLAQFAELVTTRYAEGGSRAISPTVMLLERGRVAGFVQDERGDRADTAPLRADTAPERPDDVALRPGLLRRLLGRK